MNRARDPIEGQSVLLQISLRIKMRDSFFLNSYNYRMNNIFLDLLQTPEKCKNIRN